MRIGVDIDNVLSNFNDILLNKYIEHDKSINGKGIVNQDVYIRDMFNWNKEYEEKFYKENIEYFVSLFEPIEECSKYVKLLKEEGNIIYIISGRDNGEYSNPYKMTIDWLKKYDIIYDKLFLVDAYNSHSKTEICLEYNIYVMIEDKVDNINKISSRIPVICFHAGYNKNCIGDNIIRCYSWYDIYSKINKMVQK